MVGFELKELSEILPTATCLSEGSDTEEQTRAVLSLLLNPIVSGSPVLPIKPEHQNCPNCDIPTQSTRSPYCSDHCRETTAFVRQFRSSLQEKTILDPEKQAALGQKLWFVLGGGYPRRDILVPDRVRLKVIEREGGKCQQCGAKATTIDHSGSG